MFLQIQPGSRSQVLEQPSPSTLFPSSHNSGEIPTIFPIERSMPSNSPLPQYMLHFPTSGHIHLISISLHPSAQPFPLKLSPSSQISPGSFALLPHVYTQEDVQATSLTVHVHPSRGLHVALLQPFTKSHSSLYTSSVLAFVTGSFLYYLKIFPSPQAREQVVFTHL